MGPPLRDPGIAHKTGQYDARVNRTFDMTT